MTEEKKEAIMELFYNSVDNRTHVIAEQVGVSYYSVSAFISKELKKKEKLILNRENEQSN